MPVDRFPHSVSCHLFNIMVLYEPTVFILLFKYVLCIINLINTTKNDKTLMRNTKVVMLTKQNSSRSSVDTRVSFYLERANTDKRKALIL